MSQAAYSKKVLVSADAGVTWLKLPATSPSLEIGGDVLDDTDLATNAGYRSRCYGLNDWSASADSNFKAPTGDAGADAASGAAGLAACLAAKLERTTLLFRYLPTGNLDGTGLQGEVLVETYGGSGDVGSLETVAISLQANGALTVAADA